MPGRAAFDRLIRAGIRVDKSRYDSLDCLESRGDFQALMNVLDSHRDVSGRPPVFTFNTVMGNPDFEAIERGDFRRFHHQNLFDSYRYYNDQALEADWSEAIGGGLIHPQFHAREHLNSPLWMDDLRRGLEQTRVAFDSRFYGLKTRTGSPRQQNYLAAHWPDTLDHMSAIENIIDDGLGMFRRIFGHKSATFTACNYVWPRALESHLAGLGVEMLQTQRGHLQPDPTRPEKVRIRRHYTGEKNAFGQRFSVRNVLFEPYLDENADWVSRAMTEIARAFRFQKPAVVSTHRINYVGGMSLSHRDRSLEQLEVLLARLRRRWPDAEFISSDQLSKLMIETA